MKFEMHDFLGRDELGLSDAERLPWRANFLNLEDGAQLKLLAPNGSTRTVWVARSTKII